MEATGVGDQEYFWFITLLTGDNRLCKCQEVRHGEAIAAATCDRLLTAAAIGLCGYWWSSLLKLHQYCTLIQYEFTSGWVCTPPQWRWCARSILQYQYGALYGVNRSEPKMVPVTRLLSGLQSRVCRSDSLDRPYGANGVLGCGSRSFLLDCVYL